MSEREYTPISCDLHDELTAAATRKDRVELQYEDHGTTQNDRGVIRDVYSADGEEWVRFDAGNDSVKIRLDRIQKLRRLG